MKPYVESGLHARELLNRQPAPTPDPEAQRLMSSLQGFKQVINLLGVTAIVSIPVIGLMADSSLVAAVVALNFLGVIFLLELLERRVKRDLENLREREAEPELAG